MEEEYVSGGTGHVGGYHLVLEFTGEGREEVELQRPLDLLSHTFADDEHPVPARPLVRHPVALEVGELVVNASEATAGFYDRLELWKPFERQ